MSATEEARQYQPDDSKQEERNRKSDAELLRLLKAYRKKGHARADQKPSAEQNEFVTKLYSFIEQRAGW